MELMNKIAIGMMVRMMILKNDLREFIDEQDGVGNVVATIIILLIAVLLIAVIFDVVSNHKTGKA